MLIPVGAAEEMRRGGHQVEVRPPRLCNGNDADSSLVGDNNALLASCATNAALFTCCSIFEHVLNDWVTETKEYAMGVEQFDELGGSRPAIG